MGELAQTYNAGEEDVQRLLAAKTQTRYDQKLEVAPELIPAALRPGGVNPLGQLYKHTSIGLHGKSDEECIAIFDDLKSRFRIRISREFAKRVQQRAGGA